MRAAIFNEPGSITIGERRDPVVAEPTDAVVRVVLACVCGSDLWYYRGDSPFEPGPIGHEFVGVVEDVGADVREIRRATSSSRRSPSAMAPARTAATASPRRAWPAGSIPPTATAARARRYGCRSPTARWSKSRDLAATVGLVAGGMFAGWLSWRVGFFINVPLGLAMIVAAPRYLPEAAPEPGQADVAGALSSTLGMTALV